MTQEDKHFYAFTSRFSARVNVLKTAIGISHPLDPAVDIVPPSPHDGFTAIWDTGATSTVIVKSLVQKLGLQPVGKTLVQTAGGRIEANEYLISVFLPNKVIIPSVRVTECDDLSGDSLMLIGMDIIGMGDFSVTNADNHTIMSFRLPSINHIDYVDEASKLTQKVKHKIGNELEILKRRAKNKLARKSKKKARSRR